METSAGPSPVRTAESTLAAVLDFAADGIIIIDESGRIQLYNRACEKLFGYTGDEAIGANVDILMPSPDAERHDAYIGNYLDTGAAKIIGIGREVVGRRKDGTTFPMDLSIGERVQHGARFFIGVVRDITDRKRAEQDLADSVAELEQFAYSVAHDLKAPLRAAAGFAEALIEDYGNRLDGVGQDYLHRIVAGVERMNVLINDLLAYSRVGRGEVRMAPVAIADVLAVVMENLAAEIDASQAVVVVDGVPPTIIGHRPTLEIILQNLVANAVKFVAQGTRPMVRISFAELADHRLIKVADNGIGIAAEHQHKIFDIFQRLHGQDEYSGTGIGLAVVKKGMALHSGLVRLTSEPGRGTEFNLVFPRSPQCHRGPGEAERGACHAGTRDD